LKLLNDLSELYQPGQNKERVVLTIGAFDGVHVAHRALIAGAVMRARELGVKSVVVSFNPHPDTVVKPDNKMIYLTSLEQKAALIEEIGADYLIIQPFTQEFRQLTAQEFVEWILQPAQIAEIHVGEDFVFGHKAQGNLAFLHHLGTQHGFHVSGLAPLEVGNEVVSSTRIRNLLLQGEVIQAARLLGRNHELSGPVVHGFQRGRLIGFPTANITVAPDFAIPGNGVYVTLAYIESDGDTTTRPSVTNIGVRPTFDNGARTIETHLLDFDGDLYDKTLRVEFLAKLRDERKFSGIDEIRAQLFKDVESGRAILAEY
jgi:riboflavin kinase/FMN adenylyltransferase